MKLFGRLLLAAWLCPFATYADVHIRPINVATTVDFKLYNADGTLDVDEADGGTEVSISCAGGVETTATNDFVDEGNFYSISITQAEMNCARVAVVIAATTTEVFFIDTYGVSGAIPNIPATLAAGSIASDAIDATAIAANAIGASELASAAIAADEIATDAIGAAEIASAAIAADEIATDAIGAAELASAAIAADEIATNAIGAAEIADNAIDAASTAADFSAEDQEANIVALGGTAITCTAGASCGP